MDYQTIHNYFDNTFPLLSESDTNIVFKVPETDYKIIFIPVISKVEESLKQDISNSIQGMIDEDLSHVVAGTYTVDNIQRDLDNIFILFKRKDKIEAILNIRENEQIILNSYLFSHFDNPTESTIVLNYLIEFLESLDQYFIIGSGLDLVEFLKSNLTFDRKSIQIVHKLRELLPFRGKREESTELIIFDGIINNDRIEILESIYGYGDSHDKLIQYLQFSPHIVGINLDKQNLMTRARINALTANYAVIGGVQTIQKSRQMGLGYLVSHKMTEYILKKVKNVVLETDTDNFPALKIYKKIGFEAVGASIFIEKGKKVIAGFFEDRDY